MDASTLNEPRRAEGASVWMGGDLARSRDWICEFSRENLAEIDSCLARLRGSNKALDDIGVADFPFASMTREIEAFRREIATGRGFVILRGLDGAKYTPDELGAIFWGFGAHFGLAMPQSHLGDRLGMVMNLEDEEPERTRRRNYHSGGGQNVHTDACDIVGMVSITRGKSGGESRLTSAHMVNNLMLDLCPELLKVMYEGFVCRMADSDAEAMGVPALVPHRVPAYRFAEGWLNCSFVLNPVMRAEAAGDHRITPCERAAMDVFASLANHRDLTIEMMLEPGDIQIFNNRTILHGRAHYEDHPEKARRRQLRRLWLSVAEWPRLPREQAFNEASDLWKWRDAAKARG